MNIKRFLAFGSVAAALLIMVGAAGAGSYTTSFEGFSLGTVNGQDGWHSAAGQPTPSVPALPNGYDQAVVDNSGYGQDGGTAFGDKSLRMSNAYTNGEFFYQTYSASTADPAGEAQTNHVFDGTFQFISTSASEQPGLDLSVSPDNGLGARMSYIELADTAGGIQMTFYDVAADGTFVAHDVGTYPRNVVHTIRFLIQTVPGAANDIVRLYVDGVDIGDRDHVCLTTWEQYYRVGEGHEPGVIDSFEFRAGGTAAPALLGGGYLYDNVSTVTRNTDGPAPTTCGAVGAFCSPGFWKNASEAAWTRTGIAKTALFNSVVVPDFYADSITPGTTTLWDVLTVKGATKYGKAAGPFGLNPFNAVGAALTSAIPGYVFDPNAYAQSLLGIDTCPLDHHGNVIAPA